MTQKRAVIYARVSTDKQTTENQIRELAEVCQRKGWKLGKIYQDVASGSKSREERPELDSMLKDAARASFDVVMIWSPDRLARSQLELLRSLSTLHENGRDLFIYSAAIDTTTPSGKALFSMLGVFAEFEREMIQSRVKAGLDRAKAAGKKLGRPSLSLEKAEEVRKYRQSGLTYDSIAKLTGVSTSQISRVLSEAKTNEAA